jgi:nucleotide-binding universal stress UspA family protein
VSRYLIVANQTLGGKELEERIRTRIDSGEGRFYVVVPMIEPEYETDAWVPPDPGFGISWTRTETEDALEVAMERSQHRLHRMLEKIRGLGGEAEGEVVGADPLPAIESILERDNIAEILISTLPAGISRWLKMDLPSRVARRAEIPVTTVEAES